MWLNESLMHQKQLVKSLLINMRGRRAEQSPAAMSKRWNDATRGCTISWICGLQLQPTQWKVLKSLATCWLDSRPKLDELMKDWLKKQHPAPDESAGSTQRPASRAFVQYIHENHSKDWWPVHDEYIDVNLLHAGAQAPACATVSRPLGA